MCMQIALCVIRVCVMIQCSCRALEIHHKHAFFKVILFLGRSSRRSLLWRSFRVDPSRIATVFGKARQSAIRARVGYCVLVRRRCIAIRQGSDRTLVPTCSSNAMIHSPSCPVIHLLSRCRDGRGGDLILRSTTVSLDLNASRSFHRTGSLSRHGRHRIRLGGSHWDDGMRKIQCVVITCLNKRGVRCCVCLPRAKRVPD